MFSLFFFCQIVDGQMKVHLVLDDPAGNSYVQVMQINANNMGGRGKGPSVLEEVLGNSFVGNCLLLKLFCVSCNGSMKGKHTVCLYLAVGFPSILCYGMSLWARCLPSLASIVELPGCEGHLYCSGIFGYASRAVWPMLCWGRLTLVFPGKMHEGGVVHILNNGVDDS